MKTITESTIDVVMTNCFSDFRLCKVLDDRIGDHETLKFELNFKVPKAEKFKNVAIKNHSKTCIDALKYYLSEMSDYSHIINCEDIDAATEGFNDHITEAYEKYCPTKIIKCHSNYLFNPSKVLLQNISIKKRCIESIKKKN